MGVEYTQDWHGSNTALLAPADRPFSLACRIRKTTTLGIGVMLHIGASGGQNAWDLFHLSDTGWIWQVDVTGVQSRVNFTVTSMSGWHSLAIYESASDRNVYLDGAAQTPNTDTRNPSPTGAGSCLGANYPVASKLPSDIDLGWLALWADYKLTQADATALDAGQDPQRLHPDKLVHLYEFRGDGPVATRVIDSVGADHMSDAVGGTPAKIATPRTLRRAMAHYG